MLDNLEQRAAPGAGRDPPVAPPRSDADRMRGPLRQKLVQSLGHPTGCPGRPTCGRGSSASCLETVTASRRVVYQTLPDRMVPAHLYVPEQV